MPTSIYTLSHPDSGEVRYVGKTTMSSKVRLKAHWVQARVKGKYRTRSYVGNWIRSLPARPIMSVLVVVEDQMGVETEIAAIALYRSRGYRLTNTSDGGEGAPGVKWTEDRRQRSLGHAWGFKKGQQMTPEDRLAQRQMMKGNKFALGHTLTPEHNARRIAGVRRAFAIRRSGLIIGPNWEARTPSGPELELARKLKNVIPIQGVM